MEKRIRVLQRLVDSDRQTEGEIPVDADPRPVTQRYDELLGRKQAPAASSGSKT
ncbi:MAG: hypothetical protein ACUVUC_04805 [Thermoguttaceae bacterium]